MREGLGKGRAIVKMGLNKIFIEIPAKKYWFMIIFTTAWLGGWVIGEWFAISSLMASLSKGSFDAFTFFWLIGWTAGGVAVFGQWLWQLIGSERISLDNNQLTIDNSFWGFGKKKVYDIRHIKDLAVHDRGDDRYEDFGFGSVNKKASGRLKFDYGYNTIRFAREIDEAEAKMLLERFMATEKFSVRSKARPIELRKQL